jgi:hypothetical protein
MTKKLFCQLNHGYLPLQYFGDGYYKIGENDKKQELSILNCSIIFKFIFS